MNLLLFFVQSAAPLLSRSFASLILQYLISYTCFQHPCLKLIYDEIQFIRLFLCNSYPQHAIPFCYIISLSVVLCVFIVSRCITFVMHRQNENLAYCFIGLPGFSVFLRLIYLLIPPDCVLNLQTLLILKNCCIKNFRDFFWFTFNCSSKFLKLLFI